MATRSNASRGAGGCWRRPGLRAHKTVSARLFLDTSRRHHRALGSLSLSPRSLLGIAMSTRKTSLTDKQAKNGTSKYVLERCASINEYYDIAFKVCISLSSYLVLCCWSSVVEQVCECNRRFDSETTGCTCSNNLHIWSIMSKKTLQYVFMHSPC